MELIGLPGCLSTHITVYEFSVLSEDCNMILFGIVQLCGQTVGEMIAVSDMHQRKAEMARLADAFIALPGE